MNIRKAKKEEASQIAEIMILAMTEIVYQFIGKADFEEGKQLLTTLIARQANQYSYQYIYVAEENGLILGQVCLYPGEDLISLRNPVLELIREKYDFDYTAANETQAGEIYIDTLAVNPLAQGKGIGKSIIEFIKEEFVHKNKKTLGLLVDHDNPNAKRLYEKMGFTVKNEVFIFGKYMDHMQYGN